MVRYQTNNLLGIGLMMLAMLLFEVMDAVARADVSALVPFEYTALINPGEDGK